MSADDVVRILHLEDDPADFELIAGIIHTQAPAWEVVRAETGEEFARSLDSGRFDVVLSDYKLPGFDGPAALAMARERAPDMPFILVSGTIGDEMAIHAIDLGVTDFVLKDRLGRLVPAVRRALQEVRARDARRAAERALRESEQRYRALMEQANDAILLMEPGRRILEANRQAEALLGRPRDQIVGREYVEFVVPDERADAEARIGKLLRDGAGHIQDRRLRRGDGSTVAVDVSASLVRVGEETLALSILRDVTERQRAEAELQRAQQRLEHLVSASPAVLLSLRPEGEALVANWVGDNIERLLGYTPAEVLPADWWPSHLHPEERERVLAEAAGLFTAGQLTLEYRFRNKSGMYRWLRSELRLLRDEAGSPVEAVGSLSDISERKEVELLLEQSELQYRLLFDSNPHPMWVYDEQTLEFLAVNEAAIRGYGYSLAEFLGMTIRDIRPPEEIPALEERLAEAAANTRARLVGTRTWTHRKKDGKLLRVEITSTPITFAGRKARLVLASDVTEKKALEAQLIQAQKMESVGRLAGGVAHDFNNLLGVITGYGELLRRRLAEPRLKKYSEDILQAADRAAGLTRQLLAFSRQQVLQPRILDVNGIVEEIEKMLHRLIGEDVALKAVLTRELGVVRADRGQLEQVLMNLVVNARDAMPTGGRITIETARADLDEAYARQHEGVTPGRYVMIAVSDTGHGMSPEVRARIFEPFFTTKGEGKGTGLGLATVYGIVKQSGGHIFVYSEPGRGSTFKVYLPLVEAEPGAAAEAGAEELPLPRGTETILLVEDEVSLRELVRECLEGCGYAVLDARHGADALERAETHEGPIHLLMTDVVMPGIGGRDLAQRLSRSHPELRILYMSGYTDDAVVHHGVLSQEMAFLQKPFAQEALARKVREVLDRPAGGAG